LAWFIGQSLLIIAAAFLLGILVGWLIWGVWRRERQAPAQALATPEAAPLAAVAAIPAPDPEPTPEPEPVTEPEPLPVAVAEPVVEPLVVAEAEPDIEPIAEPEPVVEPVVVADPEAVADPGTEVEPEPVLALSPEPIAAEPIAAEPIAEPEPELAAIPVVIPAQVDKPIPDDLERIEGIGPVLGRALNKAGIFTYAQLAATDDGTLRQAIEAQGHKFAPSIVTWARQAQLLADGDEEGFEDLTRRLVAGRDEGRV
jgi:predicted flap endonuclease-1-like 5' DNA nuclease